MVVEAHRPRTLPAATMCVGGPPRRSRRRRRRLRRDLRAERDRRRGLLRGGAAGRRRDASAGSRRPRSATRGWWPSATARSPATPTARCTARAAPTAGWSRSRSTSTSARQRSGVGRELYEALLPLLARQRLQVAVAGITLPNDASVALHEAVGFQPVGIYRDFGYKFGAWHDVGWWQARLAPPHRRASGAAGAPAARVAVLGRAVEHGLERGDGVRVELRAGRAGGTPRAPPRPAAGPSRAARRSSRRRRRRRRGRRRRPGSSCAVEAVGVAAAVGPLVVGADPGDLLRVEQVAHDVARRAPRGP